MARLFVEYVGFSLATCHDVTSSLTGCTITGNFYGGGSLGKVAGSVTSILDGCTVKGNVFGAGFSANVPTVEVMNLGGFQSEPYYYADLGTYRPGVFPATTTYTWQQGNSISINTTDHILYTTANLDKSNLGSVAGAVTLTLKGDTKVGTAGNTSTGNVYGGGDESYVTGSANMVTVNIQGNTEILGNVFGGGNEGLVEGSATVNIQQPTQ